MKKLRAKGDTELLSLHAVQVLSVMQEYFMPPFNRRHSWNLIPTRLLQQ